MAQPLTLMCVFSFFVLWPVRPATGAISLTITRAKQIYSPTVISYLLWHHTTSSQLPEALRRKINAYVCPDRNRSRILIT